MTAYVAAKPVKPAKPARAKNTARAAKTSTAKHTAKAKSAKTSAKHTAKPDAHQLHVLHEEHLAHLRGFAIGDLLPVCAAEAVAQSLRLAGQRVGDDEVAGLHWLAGGDEYRPVSIAAALAAARSGLAGCRPLASGAVDLSPDVGTDQIGRGRDYRADGELAAALRAGAVGVTEFSGFQGPRHALILGVNVPGPHCVLATADGWWSWGQLYTPWPCAIEEAWAVSWS